METLYTIMVTVGLEMQPEQMELIRHITSLNTPVFLKQWPYYMLFKEIPEVLSMDSVGLISKDEDASRVLNYRFSSCLYKFLLKYLEMNLKSCMHILKRCYGIQRVLHLSFKLRSSWRIINLLKNVTPALLHEIEV